MLFNASRRLVHALHKIYLACTADRGLLISLPLGRAAFRIALRFQVADFELSFLLFRWLGLGGFIRHKFRSASGRRHYDIMKFIDTVKRRFAQKMRSFVLLPLRRYFPSMEQTAAAKAARGRQRISKG